MKRKLEFDKGQLNIKRRKIEFDKNKALKLIYKKHNKQYKKYRGAFFTTEDVNYLRKSKIATKNPDLFKKILKLYIGYIVTESKKKGYSNYKNFVKSIKNDFLLK